MNFFGRKIGGDIFLEIERTFGEIQEWELRIVELQSEGKKYQKILEDEHFSDFPNISGIGTPAISDFRKFSDSGIGSPMKEIRSRYDSKKLQRIEILKFYLMEEIKYNLKAGIELCTGVIKQLEVRRNESLEKPDQDKVPIKSNDEIAKESLRKNESIETI